MSIKNINYSVGTTLSNKTYKELERKAWYNGSVDGLVKFYRNRNIEADTAMVKKNGFWEMAGRNSIYRLPLLHLSLPSIMTKAITTLTFSESPTFKVESDDSVQSEKLSSLLNDIWTDNMKEEFLQQSSEKLSYSGAIAIKIIIDKDFSDYPIMQTYAAEDFDVVFKYGNRLTEVQFKDYYNVGDKTYVLRSYYGRGYINYKLFSLNHMYEESPVTLDTVPELKELKDIKLKDNKMMCVYMENKVGARSDYDGAMDEFQAIDEIYSNMMNYIRKSKIKTYFPESLTQKDAQGNIILESNDYDTDNIILFDGQSVDGQSASRDVIDIENSINGYKTILNVYIENALRNTGLSPTTLAISETGINASGVALENRENPSMRTKTEKNNRWREMLSRLNKLLIEISLDKDIEAEFKVDFAEYSRPTVEAITELLSLQLDAGLIDKDTALNILWGEEKTEDEIELMKLNIEQDNDNPLPSLDENDLFESEDESNDEDEFLLT